MPNNENSFKPLLLKLAINPLRFDSDDIEKAIDHLATPNGAAPAQIGSFLTILKLSGRDRTAETLASSAKAMMRHAIPAPVENPDDFFVDIVGTGGDGHNTFNVSTSAAIVAAGAGARVIKHGNKASTSSSGSADILRCLGCALPAPSPGDIVSSKPFTFLLASHYHPAMAAIAPHRKALPFRTLFNVLGPLINPARPKGMVLGVADPELGPVFAEALRDIGVKRAMVVCGNEKLDELSIAGPSSVWQLETTGDVHHYTLQPSDFGLQLHDLSTVTGSSPEENALLLLALLTPGAAPPAISTTQSLAAIRDFILLNAAALLVVSGNASSFLEGVQLAKQSISSGKALEALVRFRA